jgi:hypothetical protein
VEINILSGSNAPETTNVLMGLYNNINQNIDVSTLTTTLKTKYNAFFNFTGNYANLIIINAPYELSANRVTPDVVEIDIITIDYNTLSATDKKKIDNLTAIFNI